MNLPHIQLLSRRNCCLCDDAKTVLEMTAEQGLCSWETVDVDRDKALLVRYGLDVPVLLIDGDVLFRHRVSADALHATLARRSIGTVA